MATRILVAYDESPQAEAALRHAIQQYPDAEITALHVNDPREWMYADEWDGYYSDEAFDRVREQGERVLEEAGRIAADLGVEIETRLETGRPGRRIVAYAEENDVDHVVMGSHDRSGFERFLLGSVAEAVVKRSPVSVTVIRESVNE